MPPVGVITSVTAGELGVLGLQGAGGSLMRTCLLCACLGGKTPCALLYVPLALGCLLIIL